MPMKTNMNANKHSHSASPHTHKPKTHSNYEKMKNSVNDSFLQYDQENMIRKFSLQHDSNYLYITFIGRTYRINRHTGIIHWSDDHFQTTHDADYNEVMTIYDVLCYSKENCHLAHEFVKFSVPFPRSEPEISLQMTAFSNALPIPLTRKQQPYAMPVKIFPGNHFPKAMLHMNYSYFPFSCDHPLLGSR